MDRGSRSVGLVLALALFVLAGASAHAEFPEYVLHSFLPRSGDYPEDGLATDAKGVLYGYASQGGVPPYQGSQGATYTLAPPSSGKARWSYTEIDSEVFAGVPVLSPTTTALYPIHTGGGSDTGALYALTPQAGQTEWAVTQLRTFGHTLQGDGDYPTAVVVGSDGNLYGVTRGLGSRCEPDNHNVLCGTFYSLAPPFTSNDPSFKVLVYFTGDADGAPPLNDIAPTDLVTDGTYFYGVTSYQNGQVVRLNPPTQKNPVWTKTIIYKHDAAVNHGTNLNPDLVFGPDGAMYLTAATSTAGQWGQVLRLSPTQYVSWQRTVVYGAAGFTPNRGVAFDAAGNIYGSEIAAAGPVYRLKPFAAAGGGTRYSFSALYSFKGGTADGSNPNPNLIVGVDGNLYGTTYLGGANNQGTIWQVRLH